MSPRGKVRLLVGAAALAAALAAGAVALVSAREDGRSDKQRPPLELGIALADGADSRALQAAEQAYEAGRVAEARRGFEAVLARDPASVPAAVGAAIASWPDGTLVRLRSLVEANPDSGVARLHLGLALFTNGQREPARQQWREAEKRDPDSPAAIRAEDLLHPDMPPGRPFFVPSAGSAAAGLEGLDPRAQLDELERRAEEGGLLDRILLGSVLQRLGRPESARKAFDRAVELDPDNIQARTAAAVSRFDKDDPSRAFSRLGPLASANPRSAVVRFHLGLLLIWVGQIDESRRQLQLAREADATSLYGREAARLLSRLNNVRTS
jgi:tetratricopeptide (TPR) repeat protein